MCIYFIQYSMDGLVRPCMVLYGLLWSYMAILLSFMTFHGKLWIWLDLYRFFSRFFTNRMRPQTFKKHFDHKQRSWVLKKALFWVTFAFFYHLIHNFIKLHIQNWTQIHLFMKHHINYSQWPGGFDWNKYMLIGL